MILNNKFYIKKLENIVFLGFSQKLKELIKTNDSLDIKTMVVTGSDQAKAIDKNIKINIFDNLNDRCKNLIKKKCKVENTLFVSLLSD